MRNFDPGGVQVKACKRLTAMLPFDVNTEAPRVKLLMVLTYDNALRELTEFCPGPQRLRVKRAIATPVYGEKKKKTKTQKKKRRNFVLLKKNTIRILVCNRQYILECV